MSIICCAAARLPSLFWPLTGSGMSPKCTAAVWASDSTNAAKLMPVSSSPCADSFCASSVMAKPDVSIRSGEIMADTAGVRFDRLVEIMRALRAPGGCPWDREQTVASLRPFVLEETYEVLEAIESGSSASLREELGDYLYEAVFLAQINEEAGTFTIGDAIDGICDKLVRRHPHVFARAEGEGAITSEQV